MTPDSSREAGPKIGLRGHPSGRLGAPRAPRRASGRRAPPSWRARRGWTATTWPRRRQSGSYAQVRTATASGRGARGRGRALSSPGTRRRQLGAAALFWSLAPEGSEAAARAAVVAALAAARLCPLLAQGTLLGARPGVWTVQPVYKRQGAPQQAAVPCTAMFPAQASQAWRRADLKEQVCRSGRWRTEQSPASVQQRVPAACVCGGSASRGTAAVQVVPGRQRECACPRAPCPALKLQSQA